jgi:hypothetical protein
MWKSLLSLLLLINLHGPVRASGPFIPPRWLEYGGRAVSMAPEFFWEMELKRLAREFAVPEKVSLAKPGEEPWVVTADYIKQASAADIQDFEDAIKVGRIVPKDAAAALAQHRAARDVIQRYK